MAEQNGTQERREQVDRVRAGEAALHDPGEARRIELEGMELGVSGLLRSGGLPMDQPLRQLKGKRGQKIFEEMARYDDIVGASLYAIESIVRGAVWRTEPGGESPAAQAQAAFIDECRMDMSTTWEDTVAEALSMIPFGWAWIETVFKFRNGPDEESPGMGSRFTDGRLGWRKLPLRAQSSRERFVFDEKGDGGVKALIQRDPNSGQRYTIPLRKSLLFRPGHYRGNPEGRSLLERAYIAWYFKQRLREIEAIGIERDLAGLPVAWVPPQLLQAAPSTADAVRLAAIKKMIVNLRRDEQEGVVMPQAFDAIGNKLYDLTLLTTGGQRAFDTDAVVRRYDRAIAVSFMTGFILLGSDGTGSFALSKDSSELFEHGLNTMLDEIASVFNRHAIPRLLALNGEPLDEAPMLKHGGVERVDLKELGEYISKLAGAGAPLFPDDDLENHLREIGRMPLVPEDREEQAFQPSPPLVPVTADDLEAQLQEA